MAEFKDMQGITFGEEGKGIDQARLD